MEKKEKNNKNESSVKGARVVLPSALGAALGFALGDVLESYLSADDAIVSVQDPVMETTPDNPLENPAGESTDVYGGPAKTPLMDGGPEVEVLGYDTTFVEEGMPVDVVAVSLDGQRVDLVDINRDGIADVAQIYIDEGGNFVPTEVYDVSEANIELTPLRDCYIQQDDVLAQYVDDSAPDYINTDYINNADVHDYLA